LTEETWRDFGAERAEEGRKKQFLPKEFAVMKSVVSNLEATL
jgi:hypothetical protein